LNVFLNLFNPRHSRSLLFFSRPPCFLGFCWADSRGTFGKFGAGSPFPFHPVFFRFLFPSFPCFRVGRSMSARNYSLSRCTRSFLIFSAGETPLWTDPTALVPHASTESSFFFFFTLIPPNWGTLVFCRGPRLPWLNLFFLGLLPISGTSQASVNRRLALTFFGNRFFDGHGKPGPGANPRTFFTKTPQWFSRSLLHIPLVPRLNPAFGPQRRVPIFKKRSGRQPPGFLFFAVFLLLGPGR